MNQEDLNDLISKNPSPEGIANNYNSEVSILQRELLLQADNKRLAAEVERLKEDNKFFINWIESMSTLEPKNTISRVVATRCAEIAEEYISMDKSRFVGDAIRKEFKLET